jgi:hypothetical protein
VDGTFTQLLAASSASFASLDLPAARLQKWTARPPLYHIDVKTTRGGLTSEFEVSSTMFKRARVLSVMMQQMKGDVDEIPKDVYILARVYDVDMVAGEETDIGKGKGKENFGSKIVFLLDPWEQYHKDRLILKHKGMLVGSIV